MSDRLPTKEELETLPPRLIVAYASRAAQRVLPLAKAYYTGRPFATIEAAINIASQYASGEVLDFAVANTVATTVAETLAEVAATTVAEAAAKAATNAAMAATNANLAAHNATLAADNAALAARIAYSKAVRSALIADYHALGQLSETSDHLSEDLPLWPDGVPDWYDNPELLKKDKVRETGPDHKTDSDSELPTEEELAKLPPRMIVAYAARAAQRVLPFSSRYHEIGRRNGLRNAADFAMRYSRSPVFDDQRAIDGHVSRARNAGHTAAVYAFDDHDSTAVHVGSNPEIRREDVPGDYAAYVAFTAASAVANAVLTTKNNRNRAYHAFIAASCAANSTREGDARYFAKTLNADYRLLLKISKTSDHLSEDLPLWPDGAPDWYEENDDEGYGRIKIGLEFPNSMSDDEMREFAKWFVSELDDAYREEGGEGLTIDDLRLLREAGVPV